jgi:hypothetical protein
VMRRRFLARSMVAREVRMVDEREWVPLGLLRSGCSLVSFIGYV